eukprot:3669894-Rhodomonas_salina.1
MAQSAACDPVLTIFPAASHHQPTTVTQCSPSRMHEASDPQRVSAGSGREGAVLTCVHCEIKYKKPRFQYKLYQGC